MKPDRFERFETEDLLAMLDLFAEQSTKSPASGWYDEIQAEVRLRADDGDAEAADIVWNSRHVFLDAEREVAP